MAKLKKIDIDLASFKVSNVANSNSKKLSMLTCYDYPSAKIVNQTSVDVILVGDSLSEVIYGYPNTTYVDVDLMCRHIEAVAKGAPDKHVLGDMVANSYETPELAVKSAKSLWDAGADSVKMEIPTKEVIEAVIESGIPVCGHVGLTPQTIHDYKKQGTDKDSAELIFKQASLQDEAGCWGVVLEAIPIELATKITQSMQGVAIGIAAGDTTDGQVLVFHDLLGYDPIERSYVKRLADTNSYFKEAIEKFVSTLK